MYNHTTSNVGRRGWILVCTPILTLYVAGLHGRGGRSRGAYFHKHTDLQTYQMHNDKHTHLHTSQIFTRTHRDIDTHTKHTITNTHTRSEFLFIHKLHFQSSSISQSEKARTLSTI